MKTKQIVLRRKTNEVKLVLAFEYEPIKGNCKIALYGDGDLSHHLIEDSMRLLNNLAKKMGIQHEVL